MLVASKGTKWRQVVAGVAETTVSIRHRPSPASDSLPQTRPYLTGPTLLSIVPVGNALFVGNFSQKVDPKNRVILPAELRRQAERENKPAEDQSLDFVMTYEGEGCLRLYTAEGFQRLCEAMMAPSDDEDGNLDRDQVAIETFLRQARNVSVGQQNRMVIPAELKERAGLGDDATIVGAFDHIKLWDPKRLAAHETQLSDGEYQTRLRRLTDPRRRRSGKAPQA